MLGFGKIMRLIFGDKSERDAKKMRPLIAKIHEHFWTFDTLSDEELKGKTAEFRQRLADGETLDDLLPEAYAAVKQACKRLYGQKWKAAGLDITWEILPRENPIYDVQMMGAIVLHQGKIAEMATGEGKTLAAVPALYLNALEGKGCHLVTTSEFLAPRDADWNRPLFEMLGLKVGCILPDQDPAEKRAAYAADITYGTNNEFGFDYLRDNMATRPEYVVQGAACWQAGPIAEDLKGWVEKSGSAVVEALPYRITLDVDQSQAADLLERFGKRFGVDTIEARLANESSKAFLQSLGGMADRLAECTPRTRAVPAGKARMRISFLRHGHHYAIVDEVDSILIDEARTPLIISGAVDRSTQRFDTIKGPVANLVRKQSHMLTGYANDAAKLLEDDPNSYEAGVKLFQCEQGAPKNKRYLKLRSEPAVQKLIQKVEYDHILYKKNAKTSEQAEQDPLYRVEAELYYIIDEKGHTIDLTDKGRHELSPGNPDYFVLEDLVEATERIESRLHPEVEAIYEGEELGAEEAEILAAKLEAEGKELQIDYGVFLEKIRALQPFAPEEIELFKERLGQAAEILKARMHEAHDQKAEELHNISQLLRAYSLFEKDVEYVVQDNKVIIVDEFTGRLQPGRRFSDGLHQALEAKENVHIEKETQTLATITIQNYFRMYNKLAGMTGTAETEAAEFAHTYKMDVVVIPTNRPVVRKDMDDVIYRTRREKYNAVIEEIVRLHELRLPILVGTISVEVSETLSRMLRRQGISHNVLNAKNHAREAEIIQYAGQEGQVTIATNMAGRGVDIKLGEGVKETRHCEKYNMDWMGGLQIVGTERHDARRIDRQLRGRSGRQGDPGVSRFFLSLEDDLMRRFGSDRITTIMQKLGMQEGEDIQHPWVTRAITKAQKRVEEHNFEIRKRTLEYDNVMNKQREAIYGLRRQLLEGLQTKQAILNMSYDAMAAEILRFRNEENPKDFASWNHAGFLYWLRRAIPFIELEGLDPREFSDPEDYIAALMPRVEKAYDFKTEIFGETLHADIARFLTVRTIDEIWRDHLLAIDELREGIHLRSYAQLNPLTEYQREATTMFDEMMYNVNKSVFTRMYNAALVQSAPGRPLDLTFRKQEIEPGMTSEEARQQAAAESRPERPRGVTYRRDQPKVGRNDPCPCGSGKKYKKCCGMAPAAH